MSEASASIKITMEGLQQLLNELRELKGFMQGGTAPGAGGPSVGPTAQVGGSAVASPGTPPPPSTPPTQLSPAAAGAGSPAVGAQVGAAGTAPNAAAQIGALLGGHQAWSQAVGIASQMASAYGTAQAQGRPFYAESLTPGLAGLGIGMAGAAIGGMFGGPLGALAGWGIASSVGSVVQNYLQPITDQRIQGMNLVNIEQALGLSPDPRQWSTGVMDIARSQMLSGRYLSPSFYGDMDRIQNPDLRKLATTRIGEAAYSVGNIQRYGLPDPSQPVSIGRQRDYLVGDSYGREEETAVVLADIGLPHMAAEMRAKRAERDEMEGSARVSAAKLNFAATAISLAAQYAGSSGVAQALPGALAAGRQSVANKRSIAAEMRVRGNTYEADEREIEAAREEMGLQFLPAVQFQAELQEIEASAGLQEGRSDRAFRSALFGGASAGSLPWEQKASALKSRAGELRSWMGRNPYLNPADRDRYQAQVEQLEFQAAIVAGPEREASINKEALSISGLHGAQRQLAALPGALKGSLAEQGAAMPEAQLKAAQEYEQTLQKILSTSRYLTAEQRTQLETEVAKTRASEMQLAKQAELARIMAPLTIASYGAQHAVAEGQLSLMYGAGGSDAGAAQGMMHRGARRQVTAAMQVLEDFKAKGYAEDSPEVMNAQAQVDSARRFSAETDLARATLPLSAERRTALSNLQADYAIMQTGYGSFGDYRGNLRGQIGVLGSQIRDLDANKSKLSGTGEWTGEHEARYTEQRNAFRVQMAQMLQQHDFGWEDRLVSKVLNTPSQGLLHSRMSRYEAMLSGEVAPFLGGSQEQMDYFRRSRNQVLRLAPHATPQGFAERGGAMGMAMPRSNVNVEMVVTLQDQTSMGVRATTTAVNTQKTAQDVNVNASAKKTPSG